MALETSQWSGLPQSHLSLPAHTHCCHITHGAPGGPTTASPRGLRESTTQRFLKARYVGRKGPILLCTREVAPSPPPRRGPQHWGPPPRKLVAITRNTSAGEGWALSGRRTCTLCDGGFS